jgi:hypothetical protein
MLMRAPKASTALATACVHPIALAAAAHDDQIARGGPEAE